MTENNELFEIKDYGYAERLIPSSAKNAELIGEKHKQIVYCSCRLFFAKGYHPTSIRDIATACGMSMGQLYHYISSKDDVLFLVHLHLHNIYYQYMTKFRLEHIKDPVRRLTKALYHTLHFIVENTELVMFLYTESKYLKKRHLRLILEMDGRNLVGFWYRLLEGANRKKAIKLDTEFAANLIAYLMVFLSLRKWNLKERPIEAYFDLMVDFILRGLGIVE